MDLGCDVLRQLSWLQERANPLHPPVTQIAATVIVVVVASACSGAELPAERAAAESQAGTAQSGAGRAAAIGKIDAAALAQRIHDRVNGVRVKNGLKPLAWNDRLVAVAELHSRDMQARKYFAHVSPAGEDFSRRYRRGGFSCRVPAGPQRFLTGGENLALVHQVDEWRVWDDGRREPARVNSLDEIAEQTVTGWWNSAPHRENLLRPEWASEAIGLAVAADGTVWVTQNFC